MGWKDWSYWFKGGFIFGLISFIGSLLWLGYYIPAFSKLFFNFWLAVVLSPGQFLALFGLMGPQGDISIFKLLGTWAIGFVISLIIYFIIGAVIGWIYGKIKNRN